MNLKLTVHERTALSPSVEDADEFSRILWIGVKQGNSFGSPDSYARLEYSFLDSLERRSASGYVPLHFLWTRSLGLDYNGAELEICRLLWRLRTPSRRLPGGLGFDDDHPSCSRALGPFRPRYHRSSNQILLLSSSEAEV